MNDSVVVCRVLEWTVWSCEHDACARQDCDQVDATAAQAVLAIVSAALLLLLLLLMAHQA